MLPFNYFGHVVKFGCYVVAMVGPTNLVACPLRCGGTFDRRTCLLQGCRAMVDVGQEVWASVGSLKMGVLGARP